MSGGFSLNDTSWVISAIVRVCKLHVMLITIGITSICSRPFLCSCIACLSGVCIMYMWSMISDMLLSVEYLHSMSLRLLRPLYAVSTTRAPREFMMYPMALMMSGLWCFGLLCFGRIVVGMMVGWFIFALSFWSPSFLASMDCNEWSYCVVVVSMCICALMSWFVSQVHAEDWPSATVMSLEEIV